MTWSLPYITNYSHVWKCVFGNCAGERYNRQSPTTGPPVQFRTETALGAARHMLPADWSQTRRCVATSDTVLSRQRHQSCWLWLLARSRQRGRQRDHRPTFGEPAVHLINNRQRGLRGHVYHKCFHLRIGGWTKVRKDVRTAGRNDGQKDGWKDGRTEGRKNGRTEERKNGRTEERV